MTEPPFYELLAGEYEIRPHNYTINAPEGCNLVLWAGLLQALYNIYVQKVGVF